MRRFFPLILSLFLTWIFSGCNTTQYLKQNEYLYKSSSVAFEDTTTVPKEQKHLDDQLLGLSKLQPNKKFLGIYPLKLWFYEMGKDSGGIDQYIYYRSIIGKKFLFFDFDRVIRELNFLQDTSDFRIWLTYKAGEPPHLTDTSAIIQTSSWMENYLYNRGYLSPKVTFTVAYDEKKKKAGVTYHVYLHTLNRIHNIYYTSEDPSLKRVMVALDSQSTLKKGQPFDVSYFKTEQDRINSYMLDHGYYKFDKSYIYYDADTSAGTDSMDVYVRIAPPADDTIHHPYKIRYIYIYPDAQADIEHPVKPVDTIRYSPSPSRVYYIIASEKYYNYKALTANVFLDTGQMYSYSKLTQTIASFSNSGMFKYLSVSYQDSISGWVTNFVDLVFKLTPARTKQVGYDFNANTTSDYLLGTSLGGTYSQKNLFKNLDLFHLGISGGIETQFSGGDVFINTSEASFLAGFQFPRLFYPFPFKSSNSTNPKTNIDAKFNFYNRIDYYTIFSSTFTYGCTFYEATPRKKYIINFPQLNIVKVPFISDTLLSILNDNFLLRQSFEPVVIFGTSGSWIYNSQATGNRRNDIYFRVTPEVAFTSIFNVQNAADYWRIETDFRHFLNFNLHKTLASRISLGIVDRYGPSEVVPYVKQFFVGGSNSIRAFPIRRLGPGSYVNYDFDVGEGLTPKIIDQSGDIKLEATVEYRFDIIKYLEGALFCDFGNIWTWDYDSKERPGATLVNFTHEIAVGPGAGARFDFSYVILRVDAAYPLYDPALDGPTGLQLKETYGDLIPPKKIVWNIAIGYPF